jgi:predicted MPP superfamily phosphohydrolase
MFKFYAKILVLIVLSCAFSFAQNVNSNQEALQANLNPKDLYPTVYPDRIILNLTSTPTNSIGINWRTDITQLTGTVQYAKASHGTQFLKQIDSVSASVENLVVTYLNEPNVYANYHSAELKNLSPGEEYVYRVGSGKYWSEWFQFSVPGVKQKVSFLYFGDAQNDVKNHWSRLLRNAYRIEPNIDFMVHGGDLINRNNHDIEWGEWFKAGGFIHSTVPSIMTPGNHEYGKGTGLSPQWRAQFNLPKNGPKGLEETSFEVNYPDLKMVTIDAKMVDDHKEFEESTVSWLENILTKNPRKWTVVVVHYPLFSTKANRDNENLRKVFKPIFEKYKVDLVLQGHDHGYGRGTIESGSTKHVTSYVVSNAGPKMYEVGDNKDWMTRKAGNTQLFQLISIEGDVLNYKAVTAKGELYDAFALKKAKNGANKIEERVPNTPELR